MDAKQFFYDFGKMIYRIDAVYEDFAKHSGVTSPALLWILYALNDGGEHTQREICADWDLPKSTVNTAVAELKKNGYVCLVPIRGKRREMNIVLTESGRVYASSLLAAIYKKEAEVFDQLDAVDLQVISRLQKIVTLLRKKV